MDTIHAYATRATDWWNALTPEQRTDLKFLAAVLALLLLLWLLSKLLRKLADSGKGKGGLDGTGMPQEGDNSRAARAAREAAQRAQKVGEILKADPSLALRLRQRATDQNHGPLQDVSDSAEEAAHIARLLSPIDIDTFWLAATQKDLSFNLRRVRERVPVGYPTSDMEPEPMANIAQIGDIMPGQMAMPDEQFYPALAGNELQVMQSYETRSPRKRLYVLVDVSRSMEESMGDGRPRHVWARGVTINLLLEAARGDAEYLLRPFDGSCHKLRQAKNPAEAETLIDEMLNRGFSGGGTDLNGALNQAIADLSAMPEAERSELLLITDGGEEDQGIRNPEAMKAMMAKVGIHLHSVLIGRESSVLRGISETYRCFA